MPQADLAGTDADTGDDTPASDPAADGDDEDVHVAHADDVEVYRAVADETQGHGDVREEQATGVEAEQLEGELEETSAYEGHAADIEVPRPVVNETHAHGVDVYEEPAGDAQVHDAAVSEWQVDDASVADVAVPGAEADETATHSAHSSDAAAGDAETQDAMASELPTHGEPVTDVEVQLAVADERDVHGADMYQEPAGDAEVHDAAADEPHVHGEKEAHEEEPRLMAAEPQVQGEETGGEEVHQHGHDEPVPLDHQGDAGVDADFDAESHVESEDEEQAAAWMQAGPPDATMEENDVIVATHAAPDTGHDDATGASETLGANGAATTEQAASMSAHAAVHPAVMEHVSSAGDARGMLEGVAQSLRTLAGRDANGQGIAIFPHGVDVLEVRMHISRDRDIDLNFRVAGPTVPGTSV